MGTLWPLLLLAIWTGRCAANGNVGCLFSEELCRQESEWCFDDGAFGRCINVNDPREPQELYRHSLDEEELAILEGELKKLLEMGYRWSHSHTQCLLQAVLFSFQTGSPLDSSMCDQYRNSDLQAAIASTNEEFDPSSLAYIKYTPSAGSDFADEIYYPPPEEEEDGGGGALEVRGVEEEPPYVVRRSMGTHFSPAYNSPDSFRSGLEVRDFIPTELHHQAEDEPRINIDRPYAALRSLTSWPESDEREGRSNDIGGLDVEQMSMSIKNLLKPSYMLFKTPTKTYENDKDEIEYEVENEQGRFLQMADDGRGYTEGGTVYPADEGDSLPELIDKLNGALGFKRPERLDVKKPGPPYDPAFQETKTNKEGEKAVNKSQGEKEDLANELPPKPENNHDWPKKLNALKKKASPLKVTPTPDFDIIDTDYAYISFDESFIRAWSDGKKAIDIVVKILHLPNGSISHIEVSHNEVSFKVDEKKAGMNASEVAKKIETMKTEISKEVGVKILSTGIGYKSAKLPVAIRLDGRSDHEVFMVGVVVVGVLAALILSAGVLYLTKKHGHKIRAHVKSEGEPMSKLYQDLCRARMSTKTPSEKESTAPAQRITSLSKESDKDCPSSRSSTSSWSEEPALTNMDVATGQMVLSYMEEHLKNKERLDSEWTALCAYEADPSATTIAQRAENLQKNRYPHALPYDHARVVLNELSNITGSDYINASTITDHDPRNPAYIVTQGPLAHTAPDLWQMVWEQGCVAMVMLTRLGEADSPLCFHYWPEEGSETYHVYEVHLVSEHIWCDDYLVRSFYLKNLKTGETRTVTQFHFMSWPEGGVPASTKPLLEFRRKVNKSFRGRSCPMVVHCSDGVGRSGAYILLDMVLNRIAKGAKEIDVGATLEHIRDQRAGAVATKQQFQFVLQAVADEVQAILKLLPQP